MSPGSLLLLRLQNWRALLFPVALKNVTPVSELVLFPAGFTLVETCFGVLPIAQATGTCWNVPPLESERLLCRLPPMPRVFPPIVTATVVWWVMFPVSSPLVKVASLDVLNRSAVPTYFFLCLSGRWRCVLLWTVGR